MLSGVAVVLHRDSPGETYRMLRWRSDALRPPRRSTEPREHIAIVRQHDRRRRTRDARRRRHAARQPAAVLGRRAGRAGAARAGAAASKVMLSRGRRRRAAVRGADRPSATRRRRLRAFPINIAPPTDDSPFFFNMLRLRDMLRLRPARPSEASRHNLKAVAVARRAALHGDRCSTPVHRRAAGAATDRRVLHGSSAALRLLRRASASASCWSRSRRCSG